MSASHPVQRNAVGDVMVIAEVIIAAPCAHSVRNAVAKGHALVSALSHAIPFNREERVILSRYFGLKLGMFRVRLYSVVKTGLLQS